MKINCSLISWSFKAYFYSLALKTAKIFNFKIFRKKINFFFILLHLVLPAATKLAWRRCQKIFTCLCFQYALVCVLKKKYSPVCVFLLPLLNSILAPTWKMDYLVFLCWLHGQIRNEGFNSNTINLHIFSYFFLFKYYHRSPDFDIMMV